MGIPILMLAASVLFAVPASAQEPAWPSKRRSAGWFRSRPADRPTWWRASSPQASPSAPAQPNVVRESPRRPGQHRACRRVQVGARRPYRAVRRAQRDHQSVLPQGEHRSVPRPRAGDPSRHRLDGADRASRLFAADDGGSAAVHQGAIPGKVSCGASGALPSVGLRAAARASGRRHAHGDVQGQRAGAERPHGRRDQSALRRRQHRHGPCEVRHACAPSPPPRRGVASGRSGELPVMAKRSPASSS